MRPELPRDPTAVMGRRILAYIIDIIIVGFLVTLLFRPDVDTVPIPTGVVDPCERIEQTEDFEGWCYEGDKDVVLIKRGEVFTALGVQLALSFANLVILQSLVGASLGKMIVGLRVVRRDGSIAGGGQMFVRWVFLLVDAVFCFLIGLITALASPGHKRVGDWVAGTYVVRPGDIVALAESNVGKPRPTQSWQPPTDTWTPPPPAAGPGSPPVWKPDE